MKANAKDIAQEFGPIIIFLLLVLIVILLNISLYNVQKKYINKVYKKSLYIINKLNLTKKEIKMKDKQIDTIRILVICLFWLFIYLFNIFQSDLKRILSDTSANSAFKFILKYKYSVFIILGYFLYFIMHLLSKTNSYLRTIDILTSTIFTAFIIFMV
jgi:hypothetical protein